MGAGGGTNKTRMEVTKEALHAVLDEHKDKFNWGLQALVNTENDPNNADPKKRTKKNYTNGDETFNTSWEQMKTLVDGMSPSGYTPSTRRYYEVVATTVMPNIKYRCQKSYVVMMSDGDANLSCSFSAGPEFHHRFNYDGNNNWSNERNGAYRMTYYNYNVYNAARGQSCRKSSRCLHHRLRKISLQDLKRRIAVQTAVWLHSVIKINKAAQLLLPVFRTLKRLFLMPHLHQGTDNPLRLTVGLRTGNPGKLLTNPVLITGYTESMVGRAFIFRTVVGVNALNQVWAGINQVFGQKLGGTVCGFVRQNGGV